MNVTMEQTLKEGDLLWPINQLYSNKWNRKESKTQKFWNRNQNGTEMESEESTPHEARTDGLPACMRSAGKFMKEGVRLTATL